MGSNQAAAGVAADAHWVEVVEQRQEPVFSGHHGLVVVPQIFGHRRYRFRQVVKEVGAVIHVMGGDFVSPLWPVHHGTVRHGEVL